MKAALPVQTTSRSSAEDLAAPSHEALVRGLACGSAAVVGAALAILTFYPGYLSPDSIGQLVQARTLAFNDWHPPIMSAVWALTDRLVIRGAAGMLLLHNVMFWAGLGIIVYLGRLPWIASATLMLLTGLLPPIFALLGTIWKDVGMAAALLLAYALLLLAHQNASRLALVVSLGGLFYAIAVRHNAAPAVLPLALWAGFLVCRLFGPATQPRLTHALLVGLAIFIGLVALAFATSRILTQGRGTSPSQQILLHDLAAISLETGVLHVPSSTVASGGPITLDTLRCVYTPDEVTRLYKLRDACTLRFRYLDGSAPELAELRQSWLRAVVAHPGAYGEHRLAVFAAQFAIGREQVCFPFQRGVEPNPVSVSFTPSELNSRAMQVLDMANDQTPLFRGWIYVAISAGLVLLMLVLRSGGRIPVLVLGSSGLLYALTYLGVSTTCDFRMHWWTVVAAVVLPLMLISESRASGRCRPGARD